MTVRNIDYSASVTRRSIVARNDVLVGVALVLVMLLGGYFRFVGQNWDDFTHLHPDERFLTDVASSIGGNIRSTAPGGAIEQQAQVDRCLARYPATGGVGTYFDAECSTLNPHNAGKGLYVYGTLPLFLARGAGDLLIEVPILLNEVINSLEENTFLPDLGIEFNVDTSLNTYSGVHLVWRTISALAEMSAILVVFLIGVQLHNKWVGLLAATLYAGAVFSIQVAHFGTADATTNFFTVLGILFAVRVQMQGKLLDYALFGVAFGAALACRVNIAPLAGLVVLAAMVRGLPVLDYDVAASERWRLIWRNGAGLVIAGVVSILIFRIFNPYAFMGPGFLGLTPNPRWLADIAQARHLVSGAAEMPPNWQWTGRTPWLFALNNMVTWGMGLAFGLTGLAGWVWSGYRLLRGREGALRNLLPFVWFLVYFGWLGANWVATMRYFLPVYPVMALMAAWLLLELVRRARSHPVRLAAARLFLLGVAGFTLLWAGMFTNIYRHQLTRVQASHWFWEQVPGDFALRLDDRGPDTPLINIPVANGFNNNNDLVGQTSTHFDGQVFAYQFTAPANATVSTVEVPHLGDPQDDPEPETIRVALEDVTTNSTLTEATLTIDLTRENHVLGDSYTLTLEPPLALMRGQDYRFVFEVLDGGPVISGGSVVSQEGSWDDPIPYTVCTLPSDVTLADDPPPGLLNAANCNGRNAWNGLLVGYDMSLSYEDEPYKRDTLLQALRDSDYLTISSNRFYDSENRIPARWPMTNRYYDALFNGELGFELAEVFQETFELGPLRISDQHLPIYDSPAWLNEFEAEEAFHVYDHPVVFVFRKQADYDHARVEAILDAAPLARPGVIGTTEAIANCPEVYVRPGGGGCDTTLIDTVTLSSLQAAEAPTHLMLTEDREAIQETNGSWAARFDRSDPINAQPLLTVVGWWLTIVTFGWVTWPLLFVLLPGLADRGFSVAKLVGLVVVGWLAWMGASAGFAVWSQPGVLAGLILLALVSLLAVQWRRADFQAYIRAYWRRLLLIEGLTLLLFVAFLGVRLTNPDLWHPSFGGEKPMDFAYFNGVLRSTVFPAIDPWYAGGFINYYYFGFVIVGTPVLLLGIVPSVAYTLILPTLYAMTGIGAFSVAFNVVSYWQERRVSALDVPGDAPHLRRLGNPWMAGVMALLLAVVLGNLDTPRVFGTGLATLGGYQQPTGMEQFLIDEYTAQNSGITPDLNVELELRQRATENSLSDRVRYEVHNSTSLVSGLLRGFGAWIGGRQLPVAPHRWYWGPTRVLGETPGVEGNAITELPFFTFLYGDLHAHMIAMPMLLFIMGFLLNEVLVAGQDNRAGIFRWLALALGALFVGLLRATNTWDWPTFMLLGVAGLAYAWWLTWGQITRRSLLGFAARVGGFVVLSFALTVPYITWYAATYGSINPWQGGKTPLWAYLDIHGLFLLLLFSLLVWETARWFRSVYVRDLRGMWPLLVSLGVAILGVFVAAIVLAISDYQVALLAVPLLLWMLILFLRPGQSRAMQFVLGLAGLAVGLTLGVEFIVLAGDIGRQNTVFKFYIQAWLLFSVVGGVAFAWLFEGSIRWRPGWRTIWYVMVGGLVAVAALYPITAIGGRAQDRMAPEMGLTLDGMAYMQYASYLENGTQLDLRDDYEMIRWLQDNVDGAPAIIEAQSWREYLWGGRVAIYTGMPSVLGWRFHQTQQRTFDNMATLINQRRANVNGFYTTTSIQDAWDILQFYDVGYIIVGGLERAYYPAEGLAKFDLMVERGMLDEVFTYDTSTVYQVRDAVAVAQMAE